MRRAILTGGLVLALSALAGCTPQAALVSSLLPDGTVSTLLSHLEREEDGNRRKVVELEGRRDWDGLAKFAEEHLAKDRHNADWWFVAGYAHTQAGRHSRAVESYDELLRLAPDDMLVWNLLAQSYRAAGRPQRAVQTLNNALRLRQEAPESWFLLGESYSDLSRHDQAAAAYRGAVKLQPGFAQAWVGLGQAQARLGRLADFNETVRTLEKLDPKAAAELAKQRPAAR
ncbi:MAG: tetratricopeptide repeat protein [Betaproteobacteria bacterium]|nr:tetratricopeptide repeat protein [Betaproteobacteria bacterium]